MDTKTVELQEQHKLFLFYLQNIKNHAKRDDVNAYLSQWGFELSDCQLRDIKRDLIEAGHAIGSSRALGYFYIEPGDETALQIALAEGRRHIRGIAKYNAMLKNIVRKKKPRTPVNQPALFPA